MGDIDSEILIDLVEAKPVLWDKTLDCYKDRNEKRSAWRDVCLALKPDFDEMVDKEKNSFGLEVIRQWSNHRDSFAKSKKINNDSKTSGSGTKKRKKYDFGDRLKFLDKLYCPRGTEDSLDAGLIQMSENTDYRELQGSSEGDVAPSNKKSPIQSRSRVHKKVDEVDIKIMKAFEAPCSKMAFMHSLKPHLDKFNTQEILQFQMGVLNVIENINIRKQSAFCPTSTVVNQPIATPYQQYENPMTNHQLRQPPHIFRQPNPGSSFKRQIPVSFDTNQQYPTHIPQTVTYQPNQNQNNLTPSLLEPIGPQKTAPSQHPVHEVQVKPTKPVSTAQYFHDFDHDSTSNQDCDVVYSPSTPGSASNSEQIQF